MIGSRRSMFCTIPSRSRAMAMFTGNAVSFSKYLRESDPILRRKKLSQKRPQFKIQIQKDQNWKSKIQKDQMKEQNSATWRKRPVKNSSVQHSRSTELLRTYALVFSFSFGIIVKLWQFTWSPVQILFSSCKSSYSLVLECWAVQLVFWFY